MLTVLLSGPRRDAAQVLDRARALGARVLREEDLSPAGLPDWPEDAAVIVAALREDPDAPHDAIREWEAIREARAGVDVDWLEVEVEDDLLDELGGVARRYGWLIRMHGSAQPAGPVLDVNAAGAELVEELVERVVARLKLEEV